MAWLSGYSKRLKLTVDNTNIDDVLSDFPVLIKISDSSGITSTDVTSVFTELGSDANRKKIAVTTSDGTTQCYVEIERFDYSNSVAWLWIKVPSVASGATTDLYLYYDSSKSDNTSYIGDTGDTPAQSVWDNNFKLVMHMAQDPNGDVADAIKDSTSNANHGTPAGAMTSADLVDGKVGKAIDFDGDNDLVNCGDIDCDNQITLENCVYIRAYSTGNGHSFGKEISYILKTNQASSNDYPRFQLHDGVFHTLEHNTVLSLDVQHYFAGTWDGAIMRMYIEGSDIGTTEPCTGTLTQNANPTYICSYNNLSNQGINGIVDEGRISNIARSAAWIKATYYSNWDELVSFGVEEVPITLTFTDPIPVHLSTVYGTTEQLQLTTTVSGGEESYIYDASFYDGYDVQIGTTVSGINSGSPVGSNDCLSTPSGIDYNWYVTATSSGVEDTSSTYTFSNRFLYEGYVTENDNPVNRMVRLYYRNTGELIDSTTSSGDGGYYSLDATTNDEHFIVAFDDEAGEDYNSLILDRLLPNEG